MGYMPISEEKKVSPYGEKVITPHLKEWACKSQMKF